MSPLPGDRTPMPPAPMRQAANRITDFFEHLTPADIDRLGAFYTPEAYFKDPFNEVRGLTDIGQVFSHMFESLEQPRFMVTGCIVDGSQCFLTWDFLFHFKRHARGTLQTVRGGSHLLFNEAGLVEFHRDYWDAAEELYEKLPLLGSLMRWLKRRARQ
ncbi:MAG: nuclear transport factor 2 family protein [Polaromonas sp.]|nr:nuclear transport factor 2 family protein [Polaromonas sp.]